MCRGLEEHAIVKMKSTPMETLTQFECKDLNLITEFAWQIVFCVENVIVADMLYAHFSLSTRE